MFEVWTEKYRPNTFDEIMDQEEIVRTVKAMVESGNIPHMLFAGPAGTGKTTLALVIAKTLYGKHWRDNTLELNASVSKDTPILVRIKGKIMRVTFEDLDKMYFNNENEEYKEVDDLEVLTYEGGRIVWKKVKYLIRHKARKILRIKVEGGEIKLTGNHSVMVLDENGNIVTKSASEIKEGDYLISFVTEIKGGKDIHEDFAWFYGLYAAEGCVSFSSGTSGQIIITLGSHEGNLIEKTRNIMQNFGTVSEYVGYSGFNRGKASSIQLRLFNTKLAEKFEKIFYTSHIKRATNKKVPEEVFNWSLEARISFIKGLYEGDGSGKWDEVARISLKSKNLLIDVAWLGRISGLETSIFEEEVRIINSRKIGWKKSDLIVAKPFIKFLERITDKVRINWKYLLRHQLYSKRSERVSKKVLLKIFERIDVNKLSKEEREVYERLLKILKSDIYCVKVKKVEIIEYDDWVYDVSVPGNEMFFAGTIPILLHNSDERGIDVIRHKVKDFARTKPIGNAPFKLIILDEADALTSDAQQALRRIMENYSQTARFILICNYSSKIIDPIQSRCAVFRFRPLPKEAVLNRLKYIAENEGLTIDREALEAIFDISEGDMRKAINILQAAAAVSKTITKEIVYNVASVAQPEEIDQILNLALRGDFLKARELLADVMLKYGLAGEDVIKQIQKRVLSLNIPDEYKVEIMDKVGEIEFRMVEGSDPMIQLDALLAYITMIGKKIKKV